MRGPATKTTILDAAEALFAQHGYAATSLRQLTQAAGANLAAVNYHFGSKEGLAIAALLRRIGPINAERHRRLDHLPARPSLADVVRAFVEPVFPTATNCSVGHTAPPRDFCRMFGRMMFDQPPFLRGFLAGQFRELGQRFASILRKSLPRHDTTTLWWRLHFMVGAMAHTLHSDRQVAHLSEGRCDPNDVDTLVEQLVAFTAAGFAAAPVPVVRKSPSQRTRR